MRTALVEGQESVTVREALSKGGKTMMSNTFEDRALATLEADLIVPSQFFDRIKAERSSQPEKRLMLAVMEDAIATFQKSAPAVTRRQRRLLKETEDWIGSEDNSWPFSFENICAALDIEPAYLRGGISRWKTVLQKQHVQSSAPTPLSPFRRISGRRHALSAGRSESAHKARAA